MPAKRVRVPIPLNGSAAQYGDSYVRNILQQLDPISIFKPDRKLGAVWIDNKVGQTKPVTMCWSCVHKYRGWWKKYHYRGDWEWGYVADCDGCGCRNVKSVLFIHETEFFNSLGPSHGRLPEPSRR